MKPILTSFMFSEDTQQVPASVGPGTSINIINPQNILRPQFIPSAYSFSVSIGLIQIDPDKEHRMDFKILSPSEAEVVNTGDIMFGKNNAFDTTLPKEANGLVLNMDFRNVALREKGTYFGVTSINGQEIGRFPLAVYPKES